MQYALNKECQGCKIIKEYAPAGRDLTCTFCGAKHTKKG